MNERLLQDADFFRREIFALAVADLDELKPVMPSQPDLVPGVKPGMLKPMPLEHHPGREPVGFPLPPLNYGQHLFLQFRADHLIRVEVQNPFVFKAAMSQPEIALFRKIDEAVLQHPGSPALRYLHRSIRTERINH